MAHIQLPEGSYGIRSLAQFSPKTGKALYDLAEALLRHPSPISPGDRELMAAFVSHGNRCSFCTRSHAAAARYLLAENSAVVDQVLDDYRTAPIAEKLRQLLTIAEKVRIDARTVHVDDIERARALGANDREIHDTVLIAAAFCMYNRYVDGLGTSEPADPADYTAMGARLGQQGYSATKPA